MILIGNPITITNPAESGGGGGGGGGTIRITFLDSTKPIVTIGDSGTMDIVWATSGNSPTSITLSPGSPTINIGDTSVTVPVPTTDTTYTLTVSDGTTTTSSTIRVLIGNEVFWGTTEDTISTMSMVVRSEDMKREYSFFISSPPQALVFIYPSRYARPKFIYGQFEFDDFSEMTINHMNLQGYTETYTQLTTNNQYNATNISLTIT